MENAAKRQPEIQIQTPEENHPALNAILGANPFVGLDATQVLGTLTKVLRQLVSDPMNVTSRALQLALEVGQIAGGSSSVAPEAGDKRFTDPAWTENPRLQADDAGLSGVAQSDARAGRYRRMRMSSGRTSAQELRASR